MGKNTARSAALAQLAAQAAAGDYNEYIQALYDAQLAGQTAQLAQDAAGQEERFALQEQALAARYAQSRTDADVAAQRAARNWNETQTAYGLGSGAQAQANLSREAQRQASLSALDRSQREAEASLEQQRSEYAQKYAAALRKAIADNDYARAKALYQAALAQAKKNASGSRRSASRKTDEEETEPTQPTEVPQPMVEKLARAYAAGQTAWVAETLERLAAQGYDTASVYAKARARAEGKELK